MRFKKPCAAGDGVSLGRLRPARRGFPSVVLCDGTTQQEIVKLARKRLVQHRHLLVPLGFARGRGHGRGAAERRRWTGQLSGDRRPHEHRLQPSFGGVGMLNINNGFSAGCLAHRINMVAEGSGPAVSASVGSNGASA